MKRNLFISPIIPLFKVKKKTHSVCVNTTLIVVLGSKRDYVKSKESKRDSEFTSHTVVYSIMIISHVPCSHHVFGASKDVLTLYLRLNQKNCSISSFDNVQLFRLVLLSVLLYMCSLPKFFYKSPVGHYDSIYFQQISSVKIYI